MNSNSSGRQRKHSDLMGEFLESRMPLQAIAHLTSPVPRSSQMLDTAFIEWVAAVQSFSRVTVGWVRADELHPQRHIHAALIAARPLDCSHAQQAWQSKVGIRYEAAALVQPFRDDAGGLAYILKTLGDDADAVRFSDNFTAFSELATSLKFQTRNQRRQCRRIRSQMQIAKGD